MCTRLCCWLLNQCLTSAPGSQFLCNGLEEDLIMRMSTLNGRKPTPIEALEAASGKLSLLGKLLPKLRSEGRKVLIFSQFKIMLDVVEEYLELLDLPMERIDGDTKGKPPLPRILPPTPTPPLICDQACICPAQRSA